MFDSETITIAAMLHKILDQAARAGRQEPPLLSDTPRNGVWGRRPQRVQGGALVFLIDIIKKDQGSALDPLGPAAPDPLSLWVTL